MSLWSDYDGPNGFPNVKFRPGAATTTLYGFDHDFKPPRWHKGVDRAGGDGKVYCPFRALIADVENPSSPGFGTLVRLHYGSFEIRIAHITEFNQAFLDLVVKGASIPAGAVIGLEGNAGLSIASNGGTGKHTHTEIVVPGMPIGDIGEVCRERSIDFTKHYTMGEIVQHLGAKTGEIMDAQGLKLLAPHWCQAWDRRNDCYSIWLDSRKLFGF